MKIKEDILFIVFIMSLCYIFNSLSLFKNKSVYSEKDLYNCKNIVIIRTQPIIFKQDEKICSFEVFFD